MASTILIFPYIVRCILCELIDLLVIVCSPTVSDPIGIAVLIVCVINMRNGYRHPISGESKAVGSPNQISGIVIDLAGTCRTGGLGCIVPKALQATVVDIGDSKHRRIGRAVIRRIELFPVFSVFPGFYPILHSEHDARVLIIFIPCLGNMGNVPSIPFLTLINGLIIFYIAVMGRLVGPSDIF